MALSVNKPKELVPASARPQYQVIEASDTLSRTKRDDLSGALSGYGHHGHYCPEGIPVEQAIFGLLAAFAGSFGFLFRTVTMITARRKKRSLNPDGTISTESENPVQEIFDQGADLLWSGMWHL